MASNINTISYQRLKNDSWFDEDEKVLSRLRRSRRYSFHVRRRLRVKIPNLKRFLRRKAKLVKTAWGKVCRRLKESQAHFGDLFAGNYVFMQVTPTAFKYGGNKSFGNNYDVRRLAY
ncbi:hypothetical protein ACS0TY_028768 [Phlomoides rotata]